MLWACWRSHYCGMMYRILSPSWHAENRYFCSFPLLLHDPRQWCPAENFVLVWSSEKECTEFSFSNPLGFSLFFTRISCTSSIMAWILTGQKPNDTLFVNISQRRKWDLIGLRTMGWWSISGKMSFVSFIGRLSYFFILNYLPWCSLLKRLSYLLKMLMPFLFLLTLDHNHLENKCYGKQTDRSPFMSCAYHGFPQLDPCLFLTIHNCVTKNPLIINQQDPWKIWNTLHLQPAYISYHRLTLEQTRW